jgi:3-oxoacyl-[acyl-carrier-protein] synthase-1
VSVASSAVLTAVGALTSVGLGAVPSCAAIRAGITRPRPIDHFATLDLDEHVAAALLGHPIAGMTDGFAPNARWRWMAAAALDDLLAGEHVPPAADVAFWSRCGIIFVLPVLDDARFFYAPFAHADTIWQSCLDPIIARQRLPLDAVHRSVAAVGPAGIGLALATTSDWLDAAEVDRVLVVGADSLLDAWSLAWLGPRLKHSGNPVGATPGEAAFALLIEREGARAALPPLGRLMALAWEEVDEPCVNPERQQGRGLAQALQRVCSAGTELSGDVYVNLNGEAWRAAELGAAASALPAHRRGTQRFHVPAACIGDVGAAAGGVHVACVLRSFARGYAAGPSAWVVSTSDDGDVSVVGLEVARA